MNLATVIACQPLEQLRKRALRPVPAVHKRRHNREPQVSVPSAAQVALTARQPQTEIASLFGRALPKI